MSLAEIGLLILGGVASGIIGSAGGVTSLVSYPTLLLVGLPPLPADIANLIASVASGPGSLLTSRAELRVIRRRLRWSVPVAFAGGAVGGVLLLITPAGAFDRVMPFLVAAASVALLVQPLLLRVSAALRYGVTVAAVLIGLVSIYGGFFGAGSGVMLLAVALLFLEPSMPNANALKNLLVTASSLSAAVLFTVSGRVEWGAALPLAAGVFVGGAIGPVLARRLPSAVVRVGSALFGLILAVVLWLRVV